VTDQDYMDSLLEAVGRFFHDASLTGEQLTAEQIVIKPDLPDNVGIEGIRRSDPAFDFARFLVRVGEMFSAYHTALDRGDLKPVRHFIDEGSYRELADAAKRAGRREPHVLTVRAIRPITAKHEDGLDRIRVFISARSEGAQGSICEEWVLIRKRGVQTKPELSLTRCPNCGGPIDGDDPSRCDYCDTRLGDPGLDWVVRKIVTQ
jgi:hypothetical protein